MTTVRRRRCPRCERLTLQRDCCGIDLFAKRRRWKMTPKLKQLVHVVAARKGLDDDTYRLRLRAVGVGSCSDFNRATFAVFMGALSALPDVPSARKARG